MISLSKEGHDRRSRRRNGMEAALAILLAALLVALLSSGEALAQRQRKSKAAPPPEPPPTTEQAAPAPEAEPPSKIIVASGLHLSVSAGTRRLLTGRSGQDVAPEKHLPSELVDELNVRNIKTNLEAPKGSTPGEDELSFAGSDAERAEIIERIADAHPGLQVPLILLTVAERGPYVIASAYAFHKNGKGEASIDRIDRRIMPSAELKPTTLDAVWVPCFAEAVKGFLQHGAGAPPPKDCGNKEANAPPPAPAAPPNGEPSGRAKAAVGMLDDVTDAPNHTVIIGGRPRVPAPARPHATLPPTPQASLPPTPQVPPSAQRQIASNDPVSQPLPSRKPTPGPVSQSQKPALPKVTNLKPTAIEAADEQLLVDVYRSGLTWIPTLDRRRDQILTTFSGFLRRQDQVGECLRRLVGRDEAGLQREVLQELRHLGSNTILQAVDEPWERVTVTSFPSIEISHSPRKCFTGGTSIPDIQFAWLNKRMGAKIDAKRQGKMHDLHIGNDYRIPRAIEAFAIATALAHAKRPTEDQVEEFWIAHGGSRAKFQWSALPGKINVADFYFSTERMVVLNGRQPVIRIQGASRRR